jgi:hypothetical protein
MITLKLIESLRTPYASRLPTPSEAAKLKQDLRPLGDFWLRPDVLAAAAEHIRVQYGCDAASQAPPEPRRSRKSRGGCWVLLASSDPGHPLLRDAFVLPLEWRRGGQHSQGLPRGLADEAERILTAVGIEGLSLHLQAELEATGGSLEKIPFGYESAWAALAAGAIIFDRGGENFGDVLVSAAWQPEQGAAVATPTGHLSHVNGIAAKVEAAAAHGARLLFLPRANEEEARTSAAALGPTAAGIELRFIESTTAKLGDALRAILTELESPPTRRDGWGFDHRAKYHLRLPKVRAEQYYVAELVDDVVDRLMPHVQEDERLRKISRFVLVASESPGGALLLTKLFDPVEVLIVHDDKLPGGQPVVTELAGRLRSLARRDGESRQVRTVGIAAGNDFETRVKRSVGEWIAGEDPERIFVDVTLGHRDFLFALLEAAPPGAVVGYLTSEKQGPLAIAGTEKLKVVTGLSLPPQRGDHIG